MSLFSAFSGTFTAQRRREETVATTRKKPKRFMTMYAFRNVTIVITNVCRSQAPFQGFVNSGFPPQVNGLHGAPVSINMIQDIVTEISPEISEPLWGPGSAKFDAHLRKCAIIRLSIRFTPDTHNATRSARKPQAFHLRGCHFFSLRPGESKHMSEGSPRPRCS